MTRISYVEIKAANPLTCLIRCSKHYFRRDHVYLYIIDIGSLALYGG